ncbi:sensor histidine kinase [Nocardiopsis xinjiangensis]|uniref:sensor histidine kinase n=1 Tax=Nocardiopsis xinjiangensis TaxID=124285 RepID=UPI0005248299|nr:histidine kinase [Nocardiopsis xinjiangensis]
MHTRTGLLARPLRLWRGLGAQRQRELWLMVTDWCCALAVLFFGLLFQIQSLEGWGLVGGAMGDLFERESDRYGSLLPGLLYIGLPVLLAAAVTLARRHRPPLLMGVALILLAGFGNIVPALIAVYSSPVHFPRRALLAVWSTALVVAAWAVFAQEDAGVSVMAVLGLLLLLMLGLYVGTRRQLVEGLRERAARLEREQHLLAEQAVGAERTRIARDMHDVVAHRVSLIVLHAGGMEVSTADPHAAEAAEFIRGTGRQALGELRDILGVLREYPRSSVSAPQVPDLSRLRGLVAEWKAAGMDVELSGRLSWNAPAAVQGVAHQVVREALTNAAKHATGAQVRVAVEHAEGALEVTVANGPARGNVMPVPSSGFGLAGLREQVDGEGGRLEAHERADGGWELSARLPVEESARPSRP